ncbi:MAG: hypothetical protein JWM03_444 [Rhodocyclales bacterium]|nr:hypothetical protein [Rhodocyclales bacterium]
MLYHRDTEAQRATEEKQPVVARYVVLFFSVALCASVSLC